MPIGYDENKSRDFEKRENVYVRNVVLKEPKWSLDEIVLSNGQKKQIDQALSLIRNENLIFEEWGLGRVIQRGSYSKINLYGPSGTGKTMVGHAIAHELRKKILQVNYAEIESKYVGETSKNIISLFDMAKEKDVVILFDEADALLSKRVSEMHTSSDVSVNQTKSVLLNTLDSYTGVCIFTTNFICNYDPAIMRRISQHIYFPLPDLEQRKRLWEYYLVPSLPYNADIQLLAEMYSAISGADIANSVLSAAAYCAYHNIPKIEEEHFKVAVEQIIQAKAFDKQNE